jgi:hypothetical protein
MKMQSISRRALASGLALASLAFPAPLSARADEPHPDAELIELDAALVRAWAIQDGLEAMSASEARDLEFEAAMAACRAIVESIHVIPARTLEGLRAKCRAFWWCSSREFEGIVPDVGETFVVSRTTDLMLRESILRDLVKITLHA